MSFSDPIPLVDPSNRRSPAMSVVLDRPTDSVSSRAADPAPGTSRATSPVADTMTVLLRELRPTLRSPFSIIFSMIQPLFFLSLFGPLLIAISGEPADEVLQTFVPGILVMSSPYSAEALLAESEGRITTIATWRTGMQTSHQSGNYPNAWKQHHKSENIIDCAYSCPFVNICKGAS